MRLKEFRNKSGLTQGEVAEILSIPKRTYQNYEYEIREPDSRILCKLADLYNTSIDELLDYAPQSKAAGIMGNKLASIRELNHRTQSEVAKELGISVEVYKSCEEGSCDIRGTWLVLLSKYYGCTVDELLGLSPSDSSKRDASSAEADKIDEWALLDSYRSLDALHQQFVFEVVELLGGGHPHERETD